MKKNVFIGYERSGKLAYQFYLHGWNVISCDLQPNLHKHSSCWRHIQNDCIKTVKAIKPDFAIFFPPCTHTAISGAMHFKNKIELQNEAIDNIIELHSLSITHVCIEQPRTMLNKYIGPPSQWIEPYFFGEPATKHTALYLKNLPNLLYWKQGELFPQTYNKPQENQRYEWYKNKSKRCILFDVFASAMASQWSAFLNNKYNL